MNNCTDQDCLLLGDTVLTFYFIFYVVMWIISLSYQQTTEYLLNRVVKKITALEENCFGLAMTTTPQQNTQTPTIPPPSYTSLF